MRNCTGNFVVGSINCMSAFAQLRDVNLHINEWTPFSSVISDHDSGFSEGFGFSSSYLSFPLSYEKNINNFQPRIFSLFFF